MADVEVLDPEKWPAKSPGLPVAAASPRLPTPRRIRLSNLSHVANELARVYRGMRSGDIPAEHGSRYAFVLQTLAKVIEAAEFERRIEALEKRK